METMSFDTPDLFMRVNDVTICAEQIPVGLTS